MPDSQQVGGVDPVVVDGKRVILFVREMTEVARREIEGVWREMTEVVWREMTEVVWRDMTEVAWKESMMRVPMGGNEKNIACNKIILEQ